MRIVSWNVNGLRACEKKGFSKWLGAKPADIIGLQEVRAHSGQLPPHVVQPEGFFAHFSAAKRPGYSGVALYAQKAPDEIYTDLKSEAHDAEGRLQIAQFGALTLVNAYFPNGNGKNRDNSRIPFKLDFYQKLFDLLEKAKRKDGRILVMGDFNTAHREIDLARPKENAETSGFRPEERAELDRWLQAGWVDTFRHFEPGPNYYSWWSQRAGARARNVGWRIDYVLASPGAMKYVDTAFIWPQVLGSDHCPVGVEVKTTIVT